MDSGNASPHPKKHRLRGDTILAWGGLFALWVILSGKIDAFHLGMGLATVATLIWLQRSLAPFRRADDPGIRFWRFLPYSLWLWKEMVLAAIYVARVIVRPGAHLDPRLIHFEAEQPTLLNAVLFAHSITLTPGTITLELEDDRYLVHALSATTAEDLLEGSMSRRVARLSIDEPVATPRLLPLPSENE